MLSEEFPEDDEKGNSETESWQSKYLQRWEKDSRKLSRIQKKYQDKKFSTEELPQDFRFVNRLYNHYQKASDIFFLEKIGPVYNLLKMYYKEDQKGKDAEERGAVEENKNSENTPLPPGDNLLHLLEKPRPAKNLERVHSQNLERLIKQEPKISWTKPPRLSSDIAIREAESIKEMENEFDAYLKELLADRLPQTLEFGKEMSLSRLADYFFNCFGPLLYFDSLLSLTQQYSLADTPILNLERKQIGNTGFSLAFFGAPGSGKTFAINEMIVGNQERGIPAHGLPGRNRYCGGLTAARFIRMAEAYQNKKFNFVVPEFDDWFNSEGMVNRLKLAMERGKVSYETYHETIGPYVFSSFFSVNYNTKTNGRGYETTINNPHFNAIEDRMICNLHKMTKERYAAVAESQKKLASSLIDFNFALPLRDHLTLTYAIETQHPFVRERFSLKPVLLGPEFYQKIDQAREGVLTQLENDNVPFSSRLEKKAMQLACAMSVINYFQSPEPCLKVNSDALHYAIKFFVEEAALRSQQAINADSVLKELERNSLTVVSPNTTNS